MHKDDLVFARLTAKRLNHFSEHVHSLPGLVNDEAVNALIFQIIESIRRIRFIDVVAEHPISATRKNPQSEIFDPIRASILFRNEGNIDEACWLVFLFVHFGKHLRSGYQLLGDVYGCLGHGRPWTWKQVSKDMLGFRHWLDKNQANLKTVGNRHRAFGNHRKYQSLNAWKANGTGDAIQSYVAWVINAGGHEKMFSETLAQVNGDPEKAFALLYKSMELVRSFGRTARFDFLAMLGKLGLTAIRPDSVHFDGATGPLKGAKLLFYGDFKSKKTTKHLERLADSLAVHLKVDKQVIEDSLCNWQKSPEELEPFRG